MAKIRAGLIVHQHRNGPAQQWRKVVALGDEWPAGCGNGSSRTCPLEERPGS
jgi:hypothetical protein